MNVYNNIWFVIVKIFIFAKIHYEYIIKLGKYLVKIF